MSDMLSLEALQHARALSPVDRHLAELMGRLTDDTTRDAQLAMALASQWPQRGHVCLDLHALEADQIWETLDEDESDLPFSLRLPPVEAWLDTLEASSAVGGPEEETPFVLLHRRYLYLRRYFEYERELAMRLRNWLGEPDSPSEQAGNRAQSVVPSLFGTDAVDPTDLQQTAAIEATRQPFLILTGGPGTGKTTTVVRILALLLTLHPDLEIALAAPTGKAALRLEESITQSLATLACDPLAKARLPQNAQTLHRLLGYRRNKTTFKHDAANPLTHDLVVVDEASMFGIGLMAKLLRALKPGGRLLLIGDRHQLPSVDAGAVFGALCARACPAPKVELTRNYRFSHNSGLGALASAIQRGDGSDAERHLSDEADPSCRREPLPPAQQFESVLWSRVQPILEVLFAQENPENAFEHLQKHQILCAHRRGPTGSESINSLIHEAVARHRRLNPEQRWYPGQPIVITENDYAVNLFNGDTGIVLPWQGQLAAFFRSPDGGFRRVPPARLPAHESAYALTVHKSQGSEFDRVLLLLSDQPTCLLTRELLYTGVTRARHEIVIWSPIESLQACIKRPLKRTTGLATWFNEREQR